AAVAAEGERHGVAVVDAAAQRIERAGGAVLVHTSAGVVRCGQVVVAAGVWTPRLVAPFGVKVPVRPARGDSVTLPNGPGVPRLRGAMMLVDQKVALSSLERGLRITGRFGLTSSNDRAVHPGRARTLIRKASGVLHLDPAIEPQQMWSGLRPATPDGLPMLGRLDRAPEVVVAAGHGMLGSTTSLGTAEVVAAIVNGDRPLVDLGVVSPMRFTRS
ncbi:MAG: D-amino acid dehydrogenase small subunit, partial [Actinomycetota bacterium]